MVYQLTGLADKLLLALKCLNAANQIDRTHPGLHERLIRFRKARKSISITRPSNRNLTRI
jgi:hypothetical protein